VDAMDTILAWNHAAAALFETPAANAVGHKFRDIDVSYRVEALRARMEDVKTRQIAARLDAVTFTRRSGELVHANITIVPVVEAYRVVGLVVTAEDATGQARLTDELGRVTEQHATAIEELQSTNEELETTNEELQSTNEELETTNEELQSTNEELETTVEELQAANAELAALNGELEERGAEMMRLDAYHRGVMDGVDQAVFLLDRNGTIRTWNRQAERFWNLAADRVVGREVFALPLGDLVPRLRTAFERMMTTLDPQELDDVAVSGSPRRTVVLLRPVRDAARDLLGAVVTTRFEDARSA
jgi:two-component system, chemotaxis family, CheB/CheR fusion protein